MTTRGTWAVVLAAGEGKRMRSARAKVLHPLAGRPLVRYPVDVARTLGAEGIVVVVGHQSEAVRAALAGAPGVHFAEQAVPRGTGHALAVAHGAVPDSAGALLVLSGDVPLLTAETAGRLLAHHRATGAAATVLSFLPADPTGYGRLVRGRGGRRAVRGIVEERDTTAAQRRIREVNAGIYCFDPRRLWAALAGITPDNDQGEYYLTDVVGRFGRTRQRIETIRVDDPLEVAGVNDRRQLAELERAARQRILAGLMEGGVTCLDPATTYVDADVVVGRDTVLHPGVGLAGRTRIGQGAVIGTGCQLTDTTVGDDAVLLPYCVVAASTIEHGVTLGPFARLRPGAVIRAGAEVGNFIEVKNATVGRRAKAHHVGYLGDATVGDEANIGAGTITCNYDGLRKSRTVIGARAFVGTNSSLVAPLRIGDDAYVGAGSVISRDVPDGALAVERAPQVVREGWTARRRALAAARSPDDLSSPT